MASFRLLIKPSAAKELEALPRKDRVRVLQRISQLATDPRPPGCEKLSGHDQYRVRQGDFRVVYSIDDAEPSVLVVKIGHRRRRGPCQVGALNRFVSSIPPTIV